MQFEFQIEELEHKIEDLKETIFKVLNNII